MEHVTITKDGVGETKCEGPKADFHDANALLANPAWHRYFVRKLKARREGVSKELETLPSMDIIDFKVRQARIELLDELMGMPELDVKNLSKSAATGL